MANEEHLAILKQGIEVWNQWRRGNWDVRADLNEANLNGADLSGAYLSGTNLIRADLSGANLSGADLREADLGEAKLNGANLGWVKFHETYLRNADLRGANLRNADLSKADLNEADLREADLGEAKLNGANLGWVKFHKATLVRAELKKANLIMAVLREADLYEAKLNGAALSGAYLSEADLSGAHLREADLTQAHLNRADLFRADLRMADLREADLGEANLGEANLNGADLRGASLRKAILVRTDFNGANLTNCKIYGISAWDLKLEGATQTNLVITPPDTPEIQVDDLEVAQLTYLILNNEKLRNVIDTITSKAVLILGRFTRERKAILDAIREELRRLNYVPMMFDFDRPTDKDFTETIMTLAGLCRFIIADITNPSSSPLELQAIVPNFRIPFVPIIQKGERPFAIFEDLYGKFDWVLAPLAYPNKEKLIEKLKEAVIDPALEKSRELTIKKAEEMPIRSL